MHRLPQKPANQSPPPPPPTPLEDEEHRAKIELIRAQTTKTMVEAHVHARPPMMDPAKDDLTRAQAHKTMVDAKVALRPAPKPKPEARA
jgi:cell division protein FtsN